MEKEEIEEVKDAFLEAMGASLKAQLRATPRRGCGQGRNRRSRE